MVNFVPGGFSRPWRPVCLLCGDRAQPQLALCSGCEANLSVSRSRCLQCALPIDAHGICGGCLRKPPPFDRTLVVSAYCYPVDRLIIAGKYRGRPEVFRALGELMARQVFTKIGAMPDAIVPVPLSRKRWSVRGFNQALELSRGLASSGLTVSTGKVIRNRHTQEQSGLDLARRRRNVRGCFGLRGRVDWRHVVIVDDVMTTGATVAELARLLKRAGVERVDVWVFARTDPGEVSKR